MFNLNITFIVKVLYEKTLCLINFRASWTILKFICIFCLYVNINYCMQFNHVLLGPYVRLVRALNMLSSFNEEVIWALMHFDVHYSGSSQKHKLHRHTDNYGGSTYLHPPRVSDLQPSVQQPSCLVHVLFTQRGEHCELHTSLYHPCIHPKVQLPSTGSQVGRSE